jgi:hypothetical protein
VVGDIDQGTVWRQGASPWLGAHLNSATTLR